MPEKYPAYPDPKTQPGARLTVIHGHNDGVATPGV